MFSSSTCLASSLSLQQQSCRACEFLCYLSAPLLPLFQPKSICAMSQDAYLTCLCSWLYAFCIPFCQARQSVKSTSAFQPKVICSHSSGAHFTVDEPSPKSFMSDYPLSHSALPRTRLLIDQEAKLVHLIILSVAQL